MYLKVIIEAKIYKKLCEWSIRLFSFLTANLELAIIERKFIYVFILGFGVFINSTEAQMVIPEGLFMPPLNIPLTLSGNFGELRNNHFHSGIDIRTNGIQGLPVNASASGHISRIKVSANGFGKVIYMDHPEGFTSVYAHLYRFADSIEKYIDSAQFANKSYEVELFPDSCRFQVNKGEIIGLSGNSGSSEGPHLHFEIRDKLTEEPINPLWSGISIKDTTIPLIKDMLFYSHLNHYWEKIETTATFKNDSITGPKNIIYVNTDTLGIAFKSFDLDSNSRLGIYKVTLKADDSLVFSYTYDRFNFSESRNVNAHIDFNWNNKTKIKVERCFRLAGDSCSLFINSGDGFIRLKDSIPVFVELVISDFAGNYGKENLFIQKRGGLSSTNPFPNQRISFLKPFQYSTNDFSIFIPARACYQDENFNFETINEIEINTGKLIKPQFKLMDTGIPFQKPVIFKKKIKGIAENLKGKVVLVELNTKSEIINTTPCKEENDWFQASVRNGGVFSYTIDSIAPVFSGLDFIPDPVTKIPVLTAKLNDNLTGIKIYNTYINNIWTLSAWDPRTHELLIFPRELTMGPNLLRIEVTDATNNFNFTELLF